MLMLCVTDTKKTWRDSVLTKEFQIKPMTVHQHTLEYNMQVCMSNSPSIPKLALRKNMRDYNWGQVTKWKVAAEQL